MAIFEASSFSLLLMSYSEQPSLAVRLHPFHSIYDSYDFHYQEAAFHLSQEPPLLEKQTPIVGERLFSSSIFP